MNCPECRKILNPALSACSGCGLIVDENVRRELGIYRLFSENRPVSIQSQEGNAAMTQANYNQPIGKSFTSEIGIKETSPTLLEFPNKNADLPEWRLKLQEAVKNRKDEQAASVPKPLHTRRRAVSNRGGNALAVDIIERSEPKVSANPLLDLAMQRIEKSREKYALVDSSKIIEQKIQQPIPAPVQNRPIPTLVETRPSELPFKPRFEANSFSEPQPATETKVPRMIRIEESELVNQANTPLAMQPKIERIKTNKLPPLVPARVSSSLGKIFPVAETAADTIVKEELQIDESADFVETVENDDIPPFAMRVNSAFFDLIIGAFLSVILMSPIMLIGNNLFTMAGFFGFLGVFTFVMFSYLTISIGMLGKSLGMRLFSLEVINEADSDFPTFNQSAISSSVYLLSLALGGVGFIAMFFNDDRRALHDLLSGTIVVREL